MDQDECHRWGEVRSLRSDSASAEHPTQYTGESRHIRPAISP